jgi:hypothetical protein
MNRDKALEGIEYEIAGEKAAALGRAGAQLEASLVALRAHDAAADPAVTREDLVAHAAERLWYYVVHREAIGFHHHDEALALYQVPEEIYLRMGPKPRRSLTG